MADKHVILGEAYGANVGGEGCSLPADVADRLIKQGKARPAEVPPGRPRSALVPAEPHADIPLVRQALAAQAKEFDAHLAAVHEAHASQVAELRGQSAAPDEPVAPAKSVE